MALWIARVRDLKHLQAGRLAIRAAVLSPAIVNLPRGGNLDEGYSFITGFHLRASSSVDLRV
jgi:hypothetical protein